MMRFPMVMLAPPRPVMEWMRITLLIRVVVSVEEPIRMIRADMRWVAWMGGVRGVRVVRKKMRKVKERRVTLRKNAAAVARKMA